MNRLITTTAKSIRTLTFLFVLLLAACEKEEEVNYKELLVKQEWEQVSLYTDPAFPWHKEFYYITFRSDNTCTIMLDYGGVSNPPVPVEPYVVETVYEIHNATRTISFPKSIGTVLWGDKQEELSMFIKSWKIKSLTGNTLETEPSANYKMPDVPHYVIGVNGYKFKAVE